MHTDRRDQLRDGPIAVSQAGQDLLTAAGAEGPAGAAGAYLVIVKLSVLAREDVPAALATILSV